MALPTPNVSLEDRMQRLEEGAAFAEREQEQLGEQVARLQQQVQALARRLTEVEAAQRAARAGHQPGDPTEQDGPGDGED